jgi:hypothetical protein
VFARSGERQHEQATRRDEATPVLLDTSMGGSMKSDFQVSQRKAAIGTAALE